MSIKVGLCVLPFLFACGGGSKPVEKPVVADKITEPAPPPPEPEKPPEPEPPKMLYAKAVLTPVKGAKIAGGVVSFSQQEGAEGAKVSTEIEGLKPGSYHVVIHEAAECGPNATKAGPAWPGQAAAPLTFKVTAEEPNLDASDIKLSLEGAAPVMGHVAVLHDDKKGKPGKAMACGPIEAVGNTPAE